MGNMFRSVLQSGGDGAGVTLVVTCDEVFAGSTISCSITGKTLTKTCPSSSPYTVEFMIPESGTWTISGTIDGNTFTTTVVVDMEIETELIARFN